MQWLEILKKQWFKMLSVYCNIFQNNRHKILYVENNVYKGGAEKVSAQPTCQNLSKSQEDLGLRLFKHPKS